MPFFSIVIPTTRPHYLRYSLASVLAQTFDDFEVIVAFNPTSPTITLGELPVDRRIKILRAEHLLPMDENWERGFRVATGEWVTLLGDDDCLVGDALSVAAKAIRQDPSITALLWRWGGFIADSWPTAARNTARIPPFSGKIMSKSSAEVASLLYGFDPARTGEMKTWLPSIMRGAIRGDVAQRARARSGAFCHPLTPDYGAAAQVIKLTGEIHLLDVPLVILNHTGDSMASSSHPGSEEVKATQFYGIAGNPVFKYCPVQTRLESNRPVICETIMTISAKYGDRTDYDKAQFLVWLYAGLVESKSAGTDISRAESNIDTAIGLLPMDRQNEVRCKMADLAAPPSVPRGGRSVRAVLRGNIERTMFRTPTFRLLLKRYIRKYGLTINTRTENIEDIMQFTTMINGFI